MRTHFPADALHRYSTAAIARAHNTAEHDATDSSIRSVVAPRRPMVGHAVTFTIDTGNTDPTGATAARDVYELLHGQPAPTVAVVHDASDSSSSLWNELTVAVAIAAGCVGVITNGTVSDIGSLQLVDFGCLATGTTARPFGLRIVRQHEPVEVAGVAFAPGDLVHADRNGALRLGHPNIGQLTTRAEEYLDAQSSLVDWLDSRQSPAAIRRRFDIFAP